MAVTPKYDDIVRSINMAIGLYRHNNGENPKVILAEEDVYYLLAADGCNTRFIAHDGFTWKEIPVRLVCRFGYGVYLAGDPISITKFKEHGEEELVCPF